jgi:hypothetical protein
MARSDPCETLLRLDLPGPVTDTCPPRDPEPVDRIRSALPDDAEVVIERGERSVTRSAPPRGGWRLRFARRGRWHVDPLTGWAGTDDTLHHVELRFPTRGAALDYARRYGLTPSSPAACAMPPS